MANGSFKEIYPPVLSESETLNVSYRVANELQFRKSVTTRPQNLRAYWPMDEGTGVLAGDVIGGHDGSLVGGASWVDGLFGKAIRFDGTTGFVSTQATGADLGIDGKKSRTISFWTYVEDGNPRSQPGFYGYGERNCPSGENRSRGIRNIKDGGYTQSFSHSTGAGIREDIIPMTYAIVGLIGLIFSMVPGDRLYLMEIVFRIGQEVKQAPVMQMRFSLPLAK